ncbi:histidinol-phosphate transaminase [Aestuariirhabdus litorea]|uniref:Histidinol-phosphate aminotransferase n=1 Tax=Aestuariirhabdus litorea TaxID=2528527 RepID=A0A3P3VJR3_9GAMM|nr:histidinol-phosphate transaminase [Aestuariirhabdus litorea]RRJ82981.1 histidinol-phosphate transaminase [Aestuariirhabdus litorea]RWW93141.1 histidinol-phosphate transaminase [Endozoicomonadaceae bacterium GTF-13]
MSRFWSAKVHDLTPYVPGEQPQDQVYIKLNTNESPYGPSPKAISAMQAACDDRLRLYPDPQGLALKESIARLYGLSSDQVFVGNGSDEVLAFSFQGFFKQDKPLLFPDISYSFYPVYCELYDIEARTLPLDSEFAIDLDQYPQENGGIIFPNPNAPTGRALSLDAIAALLERNRDSVVVVDEAYIDFGGDSAASLIPRFDNLLVIQTLSKSRALAGIRVGFALGNRELIEGLERIKNSFNSYPLDRPALAGATAAIEDREHFESSCRKVIATREWCSTALSQMGFEVIPSKANFVFASHPRHSAAELYQQLKEGGILVRYFNKARINNHLRITIGTDSEMQQLITRLEALLGNA